MLLAARGGHHAVVGRRIARKDAALTAAGAAGTAAAVIGTAAIVRHARKRNKTYRYFFPNGRVCLPDAARATSSLAICAVSWTGEPDQADRHQGHRAVR